MIMHAVKLQGQYAVSRDLRCRHVVGFAPEPRWLVSVATICIVSDQAAPLEPQSMIVSKACMLTAQPWLAARW
jgi:hypothetical protein